MMQKFREQAERFGTRVWMPMSNHVISQAAHRLTLSNEDVVDAESVIISTGATANWLGSTTRCVWRPAEVGSRLVRSATVPCRVPRSARGGRRWRRHAMEEATTSPSLQHRACDSPARRPSCLQSHAERTLGLPSVEIHWNRQVVDVLGEKFRVWSRRHCPVAPKNFP